MLEKLSGKKTYILATLALLAYLAGLTDKAPIDITPEQANDIGSMLLAAALATMRRAVAKIGN